MNFVKSVISVRLILQKLGFSICEFLDKMLIFAPVCVCVRIYFSDFVHSLVKTVDCMKSSSGNESMMFCAVAEIFFGL